MCVKRGKFASGWKSKKVWSSRSCSHQIRGKYTDAFNIKRRKINMKHEPSGWFQDISGWTSYNFSCRGQETNRAGLFYVRKVYWETFYESFSCNSFQYGNKDITKRLMNMLRMFLSEHIVGKKISGVCEVWLWWLWFEYSKDCFESSRVISNNDLEGRQSHNVQEVHI